jgi:hypothetical protein
MFLEKYRSLPNKASLKKRKSEAVAANTHVSFSTGKILHNNKLLDGSQDLVFA